MTIGIQIVPECVELCHDTPHGPDVNGGGVHGASEQHLRGSVPPGGHVVGVGRSGADLPGQAEVRDLDQVRSHAEEVFGLHVPVEIAVLVHERQALEYLINGEKMRKLWNPRRWREVIIFLFPIDECYFWLKY